MVSIRKATPWGREKCYDFEIMGKNLDSGKKIMKFVTSTVYTTHVYAWNWIFNHCSSYLHSTRSYEEIDHRKDL